MEFEKSPQKRIDNKESSTDFFILLNLISLVFWLFGVAPFFLSGRWSPLCVFYSSHS